MPSCSPRRTACTYRPLRAQCPRYSGLTSGTIATAALLLCSTVGTRAGRCHVSVATTGLLANYTLEAGTARAIEAELAGDPDARSSARVISDEPIVVVRSDPSNTEAGLALTPPIVPRPASAYVSQARVLIGFPVSAVHVTNGGDSSALVGVLCPGIPDANAEIWVSSLDEAAVQTQQGATVFDAWPCLIQDHTGEHGLIAAEARPPHGGPIPFLPPELFSQEFAVPVDWVLLVFASDQAAMLHFDESWVCTDEPFQVLESTVGETQLFFARIMCSDIGAKGTRISASHPVWAGVVDEAGTAHILYGDLSMMSEHALADGRRDTDIYRLIAHAALGDTLLVASIGHEGRRTAVSYKETVVRTLGDGEVLNIPVTEPSLASLHQVSATGPIVGMVASSHHDSPTLYAMVPLLIQGHKYVIAPLMEPSTHVYVVCLAEACLAGYEKYSNWGCMNHESTPGPIVSWTHDRGIDRCAAECDASSSCAGFSYPTTSGFLELLTDRCWLWNTAGAGAPHCGEAQSHYDFYNKRSGAEAFCATQAPKLQCTSETLVIPWSKPQISLGLLISSLSDSVVGETLDPHSRGMTKRNMNALQQARIRVGTEELFAEQFSLLQCRECVANLESQVLFQQAVAAGDVNATCPTLVDACVNANEKCATALWYILHPEALSAAAEGLEPGSEEQYGIPVDVASLDPIQLASMLDSLESIASCYIDYTFAQHFAPCIQSAEGPAACDSKDTLDQILHGFQNYGVTLHPQDSMAEFMASRWVSNPIDWCPIPDGYYRSTPCRPYLYHHAACFSTGLILTDAGVVDFDFADEDGGGNTVSSPFYRGSRTCLWQLSCSNPVAHVEITFEKLRIASRRYGHDFVELYDGPTTDASKIETGAGWEGLRGWPTMCFGTATEPSIDCGLTHYRTGLCPDGCTFQLGSEPQSTGGWKFDDVFAPRRTESTPNILPLGPFSSSGPDMLVKFVSDSDGLEERGFLATFQCIGADPLDRAPARVRYRETSGEDGYSVPTQIEGYQRYDGVVCSTDGFMSTPVESLEQAVVECDLAGSGCTGLQDVHCDGRAFTFCPPGSSFMALDFYPQFPGARNADRACVFEKPLWRHVEVQPVSLLPPLLNRTVRVTAMDRVGIADSCDVTVVISAPRLQLSLQAINMSSLVSSSETSLLVISNTGTETLDLQTGSARGGMMLVDSEGRQENMQWAEVSWNSPIGPVRCGTLDNTHIRIDSGSSETFSIRFVGPAAPGEGTFAGQLVISSNDPAKLETRLPLALEVYDYGLIMIALPAKLSTTVAPGMTFEETFLLYNVYSGLLHWRVATDSDECDCSPADANETFQCQLIASDIADENAEIRIELHSCDGELMPAGSERVAVRVTAPTRAGMHSRPWKIEPASGSSQSFLTTAVDVLVVPSANDFNATATRFSPDQRYPLPPVASRRYRLLVDVFDSYGNDIGVDGVTGWMVAVKVGNLTISASIYFDYAIREHGRQGKYATEELTAAMQGLHTTLGLEGTGGIGYSLLQPYSFSVQPLPCDPPRVVSSADGASCINEWCEAGSQPSANGQDCALCPRGKFSVDGRECTTCPNGEFSSEFGATSCQACDAMSIPDASSTYCLLCPRGSSPSADQSACECSPGRYKFALEDCFECPLGSFSNQSGRQNCSTCPAGHTTRGRGATKCVPCDPGTFSKVHHNAYQLPCQACPAGRYSGTAGSQLCTTCTNGRFLGATGSTSTEDCVLCRKGTFDHDRDPSTPCEACPVGQSTREDQIAMGATSCMCLPGWYGVRRRNETGGWEYTCAKSPGTAYADCREMFDVEHTGHQWLRQQSGLSTNEDQYDEYSTSSAISAAPIFDKPVSATQYKHLRTLMSGMQPPETAFCTTKSDMWFHGDQAADLVRPSGELDEQPAYVCGRLRYPKPCQLEVCTSLQSYHEDYDKEDVMVASQKLQTMLMYVWVVSGHSCFAGDMDSAVVSSPENDRPTQPSRSNGSIWHAPQLGLTPLSAVHCRLHQLREDAYLSGDPYKDEIKPLYDIRSLLLPQPPLRSGSQELCMLNVCREGHEGNLCSVCKAGYSKELSSGICYKCEGQDYTLWWRPPVLYFFLSWKMLKKSYTSHRLKSSKMSSFIFFFQTVGLVSSGTSWFGQKHSVHPQLLQYITMLRQYANLEFDRTERCTMGVHSRFYYDVFYVPSCVLVGLYMAFACWAAFVKLENRFDSLNRLRSVAHRVTCGVCGKPYTPRLAGSKLQFHRYQSKRAQWLVYLLLYAPTTRKCASTFFCRDDIEKGGSFMKADLSVSCDTSEYKLMFTVAVIMFTIVGVVIPLVVLCKLRVDPNHWRHYDVDSTPLQADDYVQFRPPRVTYSNLKTTAIVDIDATLSDIHDRDHFEEHARIAIAELFGLALSRVQVNGLKEKKRDDAGHFKKGLLKLFDESDSVKVWRDYSVWLGDDSTLTFHVQDRLNGEPIVTTSIDPVSLFVWPHSVNTDSDDLSVHEGYVFEATAVSGESYKFCSLSDTERQSWIEAIQEHCGVEVVLNQRVEAQHRPSRPRRLTWKDNGKVHVHDNARPQADDHSFTPWLSVYLSIYSDEHVDTSQSETVSDRENKYVDENTVKTLRIEGHKVLAVVLNNTGPVLGPVPLRRVVTMLCDGRLSWHTRLRSASSSEWISRLSEEGHSENTLDTLLTHSRASHNLRPLNLRQLDETTLKQELQWLVAEQAEIVPATNFVERFEQYGISSLNEDNPDHIKSALRDLCFCSSARVISVSSDAERFEVEVSIADLSGHITKVVHWYSIRVLQKTSVPVEALLERAKNLGVSDDQLQEIDIQELRDVCTRAGLPSFEMANAIEINSATEQELQIALNNEALATAIFDAAEVNEIQNDSDMRLHIPTFNQRHSEALAAASLVYPTSVYQVSASFKPELRDAHARGERIKDLGEITIEDREYDRRINFDPLSCFYGYAKPENSYWFLVELLRKMIINLVYLRGVNSCDYFPWQECLIVFLIFYTLFHNYESPYRERLGNFLDTFSTMFIVMVLHAATPPPTDRSNDKETYLSSNVRFWFVVVLASLMIVLAIVMRLSERVQRKAKKQAVQTASHEWSKFRGGLRLVRQHNAALHALEGSKNKAIAEWSLAKKVLRQADALNLLRSGQKAALKAAMFGIPDTHHQDRVRHGSAPALLTGEWQVEISQLASLPDAPAHSSRPGHRSVAQHYILTLSTVRTNPDPDSRTGSHRVRGLLIHSGKGVPGENEEVNNCGTLSQSGAKVSGAYSDDSLTLLLQWFSAADLAPRQNSALVSESDKTVGGQQVNAGSQDRVVGCAIINAVFGHRQKNFRAGDQVMLISLSLDEERGCLRGGETGQIIKISSAENSTEALVVPLDASLADVGGSAHANGTWYDATLLQHAEHRIEMVGDGHAAEWGALGPQRPVHFYAHRNSKQQYFENVPTTALSHDPSTTVPEVPEVLETPDASKVANGQPLLPSLPEEPAQTDHVRP